MLSRILREYRTAMRNNRITKSELRELQTTKTRRMVRYSFDNIRLYRSRFRELGLTPEEIRTTDDLPRLPLLTKSQVAENYPGNITANGVRTGLTRTTSGSTSGVPLKIRRDERYDDLQNAIKLRKVRMGGVMPWARGVIFQFPWSPYYDGRSAVLTPSSLLTMLTGSFDTHLPVLRLRKVIYREGALGEAAKDLWRAKPDVIDAKTGILRRIGHYLQDEGLDLTIRTGFLGEIRTDACRRDLRELFHMDHVIHTYGAAEFGFLGSECTAEAGIHLSSDYFVFEYLRNEEAAGPGERAEVVVTALENYSMPLLRYRLGDIVVPAEDEPCSCGSPLPRLNAIDGRREDRLVNQDGEAVSPGLFITYFEDVLGLRDFQLVQKSSGKVSVTLLKSQYNEKNLDLVSRFIKQTLGQGTSCEFASWEAVEIGQRIRPVVGPVLSPIQMV